MSKFLTKAILQWILRTDYLEAGQTPSFYETFHLWILSNSYGIKHNESFPKSSKVDIIRLEMWSDHFPPDILRRRRIHKRLNLLTKYRDLGKKHFQLDFLVKGKHINVIYITSWYWSTIILYINNYIWWYDLKKQKK